MFDMKKPAVFPDADLSYPLFLFGDRSEIPWLSKIKDPGFGAIVNDIWKTGAQDEFGASVFPDLTTESDAWLKPDQSGFCGVDPQPPQPLPTVSLTDRNPPRLQLSWAGRRI